MAHGRAVHYVGDHSRYIPGVPQADMLPDAEAGLPFDVGEERWTFEQLVATGDYAWAPVAQVAEAETLAGPAPVADAAPEKPRVPLGTRPKP